MNIFKSMGLEWLLEKGVWDSLNKHIAENTRYMIPGYKYNYRLCTFPDYLEFSRCELLDGTPVETNIHFSANYHWNLEVQNIIEEGVAPLYALKSKSGNAVPVRIICPDILPSIECGDMLCGQIVAFADTIVKIPDEPAKGGKVTDAGENCATINGVIIAETTGSFDYENFEWSFWELDVATENGTITVLVAKDSIDFTPKKGDGISAHALISMDVAIEHKDCKETAYCQNHYEGLISDADETMYRNGFLLGFHRNQKILINDILSGDFLRIPRCCADIIDFTDKNGDVMSVSKELLVDKLKYVLPENIIKADVKHILLCKAEQYIGHEVVAVYSEKGIKTVIWHYINEKGLISDIRIFNPNDCTLGIDHELNLHAMFAHAFSNKNPRILYEYLTPDCTYRSEYADVYRIGAKHIIDRFADINTRLNETNSYTYELALSKDELLHSDNLPLIYQGTRCAVTCQAKELAYVTFLTINDENKICDILLSRNPAYLKRFSHEKKEMPIARNVSEKLSSVYGKENTVGVMRNSETGDDDTSDIYVWEKADEFALYWLDYNGYDVSDTVLTDDFIGYACERRGTEYAVFVYAYGDEKTVLPDGDYCYKLRSEAISQGKEIIVIFLRVNKTIAEDGTTQYTAENYNGEDKKIEPLLLTTLMGKNILRYYPTKEQMDLIPRLISAYNARNLDALSVLFTDDVFLEISDRPGCSVNNGFYSHLSSIREKYGKMKLSYIRFNEFVYCAVPYIEKYGYVSFTANKNNKVDSVKIHLLDNLFCELIVLDEDDYCSANAIPAISSVEFLKPSDAVRFSLIATFENGEIKQYNLTVKSEDADVVKFKCKIMTDKIFSNGRLTDHMPTPDWMGYRNYAKRGQGIEFISGSTISAEELYHNGYPIGKFSYAEMGNVHITQADYDEEGLAVGRISDLNPQNPYYLLDKNTKTAVALPEEYQETSVGIYPFHGGCSEGLVMVSKSGNIELQYHHNYWPCAGLWGWLDKNLDIVIEPKYVYATNFVNGKAIVCKGDWDIQVDENGEELYWCNNEQWGVIDRFENEIVPCRFDEVHEIANTDRLYFVHEGGWDSGHYAVFDSEKEEFILELDFDFDISYMFNDCFVTDDNLLVFDEHLPGEEKDLIYIYDLVNKCYIKHGEPLEGRTLNGETKCVINKDGEEIIVF